MKNLLVFIMISFNATLALANGNYQVFNLVQNYIELIENNYKVDSRRLLSIFSSEEWQLNANLDNLNTALSFYHTKKTHNKDRRLMKQIVEAMNDDKHLSRHYKFYYENHKIKKSSK